MTSDQKVWTVSVIVMPKDGVNDPEGEAILGGLTDLGYGETERVRAGKRYQVQLTAASSEIARARVTSMSEQLLANPVIQSFAIESVEPGGSH